MRNTIAFLTFLITISFSAQAQFVTIPDANFVIWLQDNYPTCMSGNQMDTTCADITSEAFVNVHYQQISDLTGIRYFDGLYELTCSANNLTNLPVLPPLVETLNCFDNDLSLLSNLHNNLTFIDCHGNNLTSLPNLPNNLNHLNCGENFLTSLPNLPNSLAYLNCGINNLTNLPSLPNSLAYFFCYNNNLSNLPTLSNLINLQQIDCSHNDISIIPNLPQYLSALQCTHNNITALPSLPTNLWLLWCDNNFLTTIILPSFIGDLTCDSNNISCFPKFPNSLTNPNLFSIKGNPFTCLPNYLPIMNSATLAYPLCTNGDTINNSNNCTGYETIVGYTYTDNNSNCIKDGADLVVSNVAVKLYDINNNFLAFSSTLANGIYHFDVPLGTFTTTIDTVGKPYTAQCSPGIDSTFTLSVPTPVANNVNFDIACKSGVDIGVQSVVTTGWVFPGQPHQLNILAGNMSQWYNLNCATGVSGIVQVTISGNVTFDGVSSGSLAPVVSGNVYTYNIPDFSLINFQSDFSLLFTTNTTAQFGDSICVNVVVTPTSGDINQSNNFYTFCYNVINSYDPNNKEVYPLNLAEGSQDWLTYTIHFQNTGTAPAFNIRLVDTLDNNLDLNTFEVINYSHPNIVTLNQNLLTFRFPNIMLPDSTSNFNGSQGFVQYRLKPKANLTVGTQIENTAYIYFDYNAAVETNTVTTNFLTSVGQIQLEKTGVKFYPNPTKDIFNINTSMLIKTIEVHNVMGQLILSLNNAQSIDLSNQPNGIYFVKLNGFTIHKIVKN